MTGSTIGGVTVLRRRFPWKTTGILLATVLYLFAVIHYWWWIDDGDARGVFAAVILGLLAGFVSIAKSRILWAWLTGPRTLSFEGQYFKYGDEPILYESITGLSPGEKFFKGTRILRDGAHGISLYEEVWPHAEEWSGLLEQKVFPHLIETTMQRLNAGETVAFTRAISLDSQSLRLKDGSIPLKDLSAVRTVSAANNSYTYIEVTAKGRAKPFGIGTMVNSPVFFEVIKRLTNAAQL
jgi:hypothetical protein